MSEKVRIPFSERVESMKRIAELTTELKTVVESMNAPPTIIKAYQNSIVNLETKNQKYGSEKERFSMSEEEKEMILKFREGKVKISPVKEKKD